MSMHEREMSVGTCEGGVVREVSVSRRVSSIRGLGKYIHKKDESCERGVMSLSDSRDHEWIFRLCIYMRL